MLSLNATQLAIVASDYKKVSWLFTVVDSAGPTTYYWSTITRSYGGHNYVYKIDPSSFNGITLNRASSEIGIQAPNDLSFDVENSGNALTASNFIGGTVTLDLVISDGTNEEIICSWKFNIKRCEAIYQKLSFICEDFIQQYLEGDYPNTQLIKDINPSTDPDVDDNVCVPRPIGTCYIPLRTLYITDQRYYLLGLTSAGTYTITKVRSPRSWGAGKSEWDSGSYTFTQSTKTINAVNWRVFQAIIADSDGNGSADANGLWRQGDYFLDMPTKFSCSDTSSKTNPADAIEFILEDMGIASADIDTGVGSSFETAATTFTSWGLTFNGAFYRKQSKEQILAMLLNSCHSTLQITDKIELHVLSKTSQKTITKADVLRTIIAGAGTFKYSLVTEKQSDSGYIGFQIADESQDEFIKKLVPAKASTDHISSEVLDIPLVQDTQNVQRIGTLYYQRKFLKKANISFSNKGSTLLALQPDDVTTINHADYGGNYPALINSMTIKHDLSIDFNCTQFSETLDDWTDLSPAVITPEVDDSGVVFNSVGNRIFSVQPYPPYDIGDLWVGGPSGDIKRCITARTSGAYQAGDWGLASNYDETATHTAQNLQYNGDFELDASGETDPTHWDRTINGTPSHARVWATTPESYWPPWKPGGHVFYGNCDDAAEWVRLISDYFFPVSQDSYYCLSAWVRAHATGTGNCYLGILWYDKDYVLLSTDYVCMNGYDAAHTWEQKSSAAVKPSDYEATARYIKIKAYPQFETVGGTFISRIQFVESKTPVAWEVSYAVAPGSDKTGDNTAADISGQGDLATTNEADADVLNMTNAPAEANADKTSTKTANNAANYTGNSIAVGHTAAKCTDATADKTSTHKANDTTYINGSVNQSGQGDVEINDDLKMMGTDISFYYSGAYKGGIYAGSGGILINATGGTLLLSPLTDVIVSGNLKPLSMGLDDHGSATYRWRTMYSKNLNISTGDITMATSGSPFTFHYSADGGSTWETPLVAYIT